MKRYPTQVIELDETPKDVGEKHKLTSDIIKQFLSSTGSHLTRIMANKTTIETCINEHVCETNEVYIKVVEDIPDLTVELYR